MAATTIQITPATSNADVDAARGLFEEYAATLGIDLCFQGFDRELVELPGDYSPPSGRLLLARDAQGRPVGCVALRSLGDDACEMKRLYVSAGQRGSGLGRLLAEVVIDEARAIGYRVMRLDTLPSMAEAAALYVSLGFSEIEPYYSSPVVGARFLELDLG